MAKELIYTPDHLMDSINSRLPKYISKISTIEELNQILDLAYDTASPATNVEVHRTIFQMRYFEGKTTSEIAEVVHIPANQLPSKTCKWIGKLAECARQLARRYGKYTCKRYELREIPYLAENPKLLKELMLKYPYEDCDTFCEKLKYHGLLRVYGIGCNEAANICRSLQSIGYGDTCLVSSYLNLNAG